MNKTIKVSLAAILFSGIFFLFLPTFKSQANIMDAAYFLLSRMEADIDGSSEEVEYIIALATNQNIPTSGTVTIQFPDADDTNWCRTAGALTITAVSSSVVDLSSTDWEIDAVLPDDGNALTATCTQGSGSNSVDTIVVSNVGALTAGSTYGFMLENGSSAGVLGTDDTPGDHYVTLRAESGATLDSSTFGLELVANDTVTVSATVEDTPSISCSISSNSVNLGSLFPGGAYNTAAHTIQTTTSTNASGYYWASYGEGDGSTDAGLYKSTSTTYLIPSTGSTSINLTGVSAEGFGMTVSDPDGAGAAVVPSDFSNAVPGVFGALDRTSSGIRMILYQPSAQTSPDTATVTYGAKAGSSAEAGSYSEEVKFVCGAYY